MAEDGWQDVLGSGALLRKIVQPGEGPAAERGSKATIVASLQVDDRQVYEKKTMTFRTGEGDVSTALDVCVPMMQLQEHCLIKSSYRFDKLDGANPDSEILYTVHLTHLEHSAPLDEMADEDRVAIAQQRRIQGNEELKAGEFQQAIATYKRAIGAVNKSADNTEVPESPILQAECVKLYNNLALAYIKLKQYKIASEKCDVVLTMEPRNLKSLARKFTALLELERLEDAREVVKLGLTVDEEMFRVHEVKLKRKQKAQDDASKAMYMKMMAGLSQGKGVEGEAAAKTEEAEVKELKSKAMFYVAVAVAVGVIIAGLAVVFVDP